MIESQVDNGSVLLIEEDEATRIFLSDNLTADGYKVEAPMDEVAALEALEVRRFDVVVLDAASPVGVAAVRERAGYISGLGPGLCVVGNVPDPFGDEESLEDGDLSHHFEDAGMRRPFTYPELRRQVEALIQRRTLR